MLLLYDKKQTCKYTFIFLFVGLILFLIIVNDC